jgi:hypothetical protein
VEPRPPRSSYLDRFVCGVLAWRLLRRIG